MMFIDMKNTNAPTSPPKTRIATCQRHVSQTPIPAAPSSIVKKPMIQSGPVSGFSMSSVATMAANFSSHATAPTSRRPVEIRSHLTSVVRSLRPYSVGFVMPRP